MTEPRLDRASVDGIPLISATPTRELDRSQLALFLPYLGGTKEAVAPYLTELAQLGFTAVSFDPWRLGERGDGDNRAVMQQVFDHFRRDMWPILGQTTLDAIHVLDWAVDHFALSSDNIVAGGLSMGGDVSLALAGADHRVSRVAAVVATPDWTRPGMTLVDHPSTVIDQGQPTAYGAWLYENLNRITNLKSYEHGPAIALELGAEDTHVPPASAYAFREALQASAPEAAARIRIITHKALGHLTTVRDDRVQAAVIAWMATR